MTVGVAVRVRVGDGVPVPGVPVGVTDAVCWAGVRVTVAVGVVVAVGESVGVTLRANGCGVDVGVFNTRGRTGVGRFSLLGTQAVAVGVIFNIRVISSTYPIDFWQVASRCAETLAQSMGWLALSVDWMAL